MVQLSTDPFIPYLVDERNTLFYERIRQHCIEKGRMFVALGSLHLFGEHGLLAMFKADGYTVNWVP